MDPRRWALDPPPLSLYLITILESCGHVDCYLGQPVTIRQSYEKNLHGKAACCLPRK
jgi:hypothetical protein